MQSLDIRPLKQRLRNEIKDWRRSLPPEKKASADQRITQRLLRLKEYQACKLLLTYVSLPIEVDTLALIQQAQIDGKQVAVPRCVEGTRQMEFYLIQGLEDLAPQMFGVLEPVRERCERLERFEESLCVVPALAYDHAGYRLGYGAGYYDRFLSGYQGKVVGITYQKNLCRHLWHGRFDVPVELVVTEKRILVSRAGVLRHKRQEKRK